MTPGFGVGNQYEEQSNMQDGISPAERNGSGKHSTLGGGERGEPNAEAAGVQAENDPLPDAGPAGLAALPARGNRLAEQARCYQTPIGRVPAIRLEELLERWGPYSRQQQSDGSWLVSCPVDGHGQGNGDRNPSLHLTVNEDGRLLWRCMAGCSQDAVQSALGVSGSCRVIGDDGYALTPARPLPPPLTDDEADQRHQHYAAVLSPLPLTPAHQQHLLGRGLTEVDIELAGYRSHTDGLLIPYRDPAGHILGMQVRRFGGGDKYKWFGTGNKAGDTPHVPLACSDLSADVVRVTEGGLKADVVAALEHGAGADRVITVGVAGTQQWKAALPLLRQWRTQTVRLAFDQDEPGRKAQATAAAYLKEQGYEVHLEVWDGAAYKGLDNLLAAGQAPEVLTGRAVWERIRRDSPPVQLRRRALSRAELKGLGDPIWLIDRHIVTESLAVLSGESGVGKSFVAIDYALSLATGRQYLDKYSVKQGPVLYIAAEGGRGVGKRVDAWEQHHKAEVRGDAFWLIPDAFTFTQHGGEEWSELRANIEQVMQVRPVLVVVDTLARNIGGNENDPLDMTKFIGTCDWLRTTFGCAVLVVHHLGKDHTRGERGHTSLKGNVDTRLLMTEVGTNSYKLECLKQKDFEPPDPYLLRRETVNLGAGRTSLVLVPESADVSVPTAQEQRQQAQAAEQKGKKEKDAEKVYQLLLQHPQGLSHDGVKMKMPGWGDKRTKSALTLNIQKGRIHKQPGSGRNADLYRAVPSREGTVIV